MRTIYFCMLLLALPTVAAAQNHSPMEHKPLISTNQAGIAINGYDTVAYFDQKKAVKGRKEFACDYKEATWYFSSEENKNKFLADPEKFAPQYGGYCTHALAENELIEANPKAFVIKDNKLYLYSKKKFAKKVEFTFEKERRVRDQNWLSFNKSFAFPRAQ